MRLRRAGMLALLFLGAGAAGAGGFVAVRAVMSPAEPAATTAAAPARDRTAATGPARIVAEPAEPNDPPVQTEAALRAPPADDPNTRRPVVPPTVSAPDDDTPQEYDSVDPVIITPNPGAQGAGGARKRGLVILQIGDSHTSADFLTGELRRRLQARYGRGAPGYITAGKPHIGVRTSSLTISASSGWSYRSLQRPDARVPEFWLAGYSAIASAAGETMTFASGQPVTFDTIEIEAVAQPGGGAIEVKLDGKVEATQDLAASRTEPVIIRLLPGRAATEKVREISITTTKSGTVNLASVAIYNSRSGVTYNSVGYVGATVSLVNKFDKKLFASALQRLDPQIVVMSFGTNEAASEIDLGAYGRAYARAIDRIKEVLPDAVIVVVSPPDYNEMPGHCRKEQAAEASCRRGGEAVASIAAPPASNGGQSCTWRTPAKLQQIRDVQRDIAQRYQLVYWNWASIMPRECGAHQWFRSSPQLMAKDHVHFTISGYKKSAEQFLNTLIPIIEKVRVGAHVIPNN